MKYLITFTLLLLSATSLLAQASIRGKISSIDEEAVAYANVVLKTTLDSSIVKIAATDESGTFQLPGLEAGSYFLTVSYVGYSPYRSKALEIKAEEQREVAPIRLQNTDTELSEVTVTADRSVLEVRPDKLVFNVENSVGATGSTAFELLRKSPGIIIDNNNNILLAGASGVRIFINGKPSPLLGEDLQVYLQSLQSSEVKAIEVINNPGARYEAEGNAGIINMRLKKNQKLGANARVNGNYSVGILPQYNGGITGNYRDQGINVFGSYNYGCNFMRNVFDMYRQQPGGIFDMQQITRTDYSNHSFKLGTDLFLSEKATLGVLVNGNETDFAYNNNSDTRISSAVGAPVDSFLLASNLREDARSNYNFNLNYQWREEKGASWNIDADYGRFRSQTDQDLKNEYSNAEKSQTLQQRDYQATAPTRIDIYTFRADYTQPLGTGSLESGVKLAMVQTDNDFDWFDMLPDGQRQLDIDRSNRFRYQENVNAAYTSYQSKLGKKWNIKAGLRGEWTRTKSDLTAQKETANASVDSSYFNLFPSAGLTYQLNPKNSLRLNYSRRLNRPNYQNLNPFEFKSNELSFRRGNPFLRPEFTNKLQLTHTYNYRFTTSISFSRTRDLITNITDIEGEKASIITYLNLAEQHNYSISVSAPLNITDWWSTYSSITAYRVENQADYGNGRIIDLDQNTLNIYSQQTFTLPGTWKAEISGWYQSPSIWGGTFETNAMYSISAGVQTRVMQGRGRLSLNVNDVFFTAGWTATSRLGALFQDGGAVRDSRRVRISFNYLLGNDKVKDARKRKTGLESEKGRLGQ